MHAYIDQNQQKQNNFLENIPNKIPVQLFTVGIDFWESFCQILTFINFLSNKRNKSRKFQVNDFFYKPWFITKQTRPTILGQTLGLYFWDFRVPLRMMNVAVRLTMARFFFLIVKGCWSFPKVQKRLEVFL